MTWGYLTALVMQQIRPIIKANDLKLQVELPDDKGFVEVSGFYHDLQQRAIVLKTEAIVEAEEDFE